MKILIAEDDLASRRLIYMFMSKYGQCDITVNGAEAIEAFIIALEDGEAYDLVCLDIMMPKLDGLKVLSTIRDLEKEKNIKDVERSKIIMMTALNDTRTITNSFNSGCEAYAAKPIDLNKLEEVMKKLGFVE